MSETQPVPTPGAARDAGGYRTRSTAWAGWVVFAGVLMIMVGGFQALMGLVALFKDEYYQVTRSGLLVSVDYTTWGWVHLLLGAIACVAGVGVLVGQTWARVTGIVLAVLSALVNIAFLSAYPIWGVTVIALDVIVIYALAVHGGDVRDMVDDSYYG
jgi:hypothetical protein